MAAAQLSLHAGQPLQHSVRGRTGHKAGPLRPVCRHWLPSLSAAATADAPEAAAIGAAPPLVEFLGLVDGMLTVQGSIDVVASEETVYAALTDYAGNSDVFSNVAASSALVADDGALHVTQDCRWRFLGLSGTFKVVLAMEETPTERLLVFKLVHSSFMRDFSGRWRVVPTSSSSSGSSSCRVEHVLAVKPLVPVPAAFAGASKRIFTVQVEEILRDLQTYATRALEEPLA